MLTSGLIKIPHIRCPLCGGYGKEVVGEYRVTRDMALDAGYPEMEGTFYEYAYETCSQCGGSGVIEDKENNDKQE